MTGEHSPATALPLEEVTTSEDPQAIFDILTELDERIDELTSHHRVLSGLTKQSYQHSQQTWSRVVELTNRMAVIEDNQTRIISELAGISSLLKGVAAAVEPSGGAPKSPETPMA